MSTTATTSPTDGLILTPAQASALLDEYVCFEYAVAATDFNDVAERGVVEEILEAKGALDRRDVVVRALHLIASGTQPEPFATAGMRDNLRKLVALGLEHHGDNLKGVATGPNPVPDVTRTIRVAGDLLGILEQLEEAS